MEHRKKMKTLHTNEGIVSSVSVWFCKLNFTL